MRELKRIFRALPILLLIWSLLPLSSCGSGAPLTVLDRNGKPLATLASPEWEQSLSDPELAPYLEIAVEEAVLAVAEVKELSEEQARKQLFQKGYVLHTAFDPMVFDAMKTGFAQGGTDQLDFACACTDLKGKLVAVFSNGVENFAIRRTQPYSSFKPLSVYMQALERGIINWSTVYRDEPLKQITGEDGQLHNWPANASNTYSYENTPVSFAVKKSLNTVASACLLDVGVANSISFLKKNFGISMPAEEMRMNLVGEEEIIGNLSMGFLTDGVSPVEMAGFYQCFANGGTYAAPSALVKIELGGKVICEPSKEEKRVLTEANAHIMNRLLQQVIGPEGTGSAARLEGIPLGGKTGTGDNGNWFVGFTPEYSCSVWHGDQLGENAAAKYFAQIFSEIELDPEAAFPESESVKQGIYCKRTGLLYSDACHDADVGYYESGKMPVFCKE